eukprot:gene33701-41576_t
MSSDDKLKVPFFKTFDLNSLGGDDEDNGLYPLTMKMSHSCRPNSSIKIRGNKLTCRCVSVILKGAEITRTYCENVLFLSTAERQTHFSFVCDCDRCTAPGDDTKQFNCNQYSCPGKYLICQPTFEDAPFALPCTVCGHRSDEDTDEISHCTKEGAMTQLAQQSKELAVLVEKCQSESKLDALLAVFERMNSEYGMSVPANQLLHSFPTHHVEMEEIFLLMFKYYKIKRNAQRVLFYATRYFELFNDLMGGLPSRALMNMLTPLVSNLASIRADGSDSLQSRGLLELSLAVYRKVLSVYLLVEGGRHSDSEEDDLPYQLRGAIAVYLTCLSVQPKLTECMLCGESPERVAITLNRCGRCGQVAYCSKGCQTAHWKVHKKGC